MEKLGNDKKQIKIQSQDLLSNTHIMTAFSDCDSKEGLGRNSKENYDPIRKAIKHILLEVDDQTDRGLIVLFSLKDLPGFLRCLPEAENKTAFSKVLFVFVLL